MTRGKTRLVDTCRYLVRRKHLVFLEESQEAPNPYDPSRGPLGDPDLPGEMWIHPNPEVEDIHTIYEYALTVGGYDYARDHFGMDCADFVRQKWEQYQETGKLEGGFEELRLCLFMEQRKGHWDGEGVGDQGEKAVLELHKTICERWEWEVEFIPNRPIKDPRELKMLDPACGSMHFGLYAFDLFEQIYSEAWDLEERLGEQALQRLSDLESLHKTYPDKDAFFAGCATSKH
jgi:hypothetical protein